MKKRKPIAWLELVTLTSGNRSAPTKEWRVTCNPPTSLATRIPIYKTDESWEHYKKATGKVVPGDKQHSFFSCSC